MYSVKMDRLFEFVFLIAVITFVSYMHTDSSNEDNSSLVKTKYGTIQGVPLKSRKGRTYHGFLGLPFGKIPQRFDSAITPDGWEGIRNGTALPQPCFQYFVFTKKLIGDEDCLKLNVYSPDTRASGKKKLPVFVFSIPGGFQIGGASLFEAKYFMDEDIVLVTTNYRVGVFGFLNTGEGTVAGNMGMKDQVLALKWIQENIANFGGDPNLVTIFGLSAGAASVQYLTISDMAKGLFHRALALSGSALNPWAFQHYPGIVAQNLAVKTNCSEPGWTWDQKVACLRQMTPHDLTQSSLYYAYTLPGIDFAYIHKQFVPSVESDKVNGPRFLIDTPYNLLSKGQIASSTVPMVIGFTGNEGAMWSARYEKLYKKIEQDWNTMAPYMLYYNRLLNDTMAPIVSAKILNFYVEDAPIQPNSSAVYGMTELFSDRLFRNGVAKGIKLQGKVNPVYPYINDYKGKHSLIFSYGINETHGMSHGDELVYIFNGTLGSAEILDEGTRDREYSERFIKFLVEFGKTGKPEGWGKVKEWGQYESGKEIKYYRMDLENTDVVDDVLEKRRLFWDLQDIEEHEKHGISAIV